MKNKEVINVDITINVDAVKAAARNSSKLRDVALELPVADPRDLSIDDQIFGIVIKPVHDDEKKITPDSSVYVAVEPIMVDTLSGRAKPGFITVNGTFDIPKESGRITKLEDCYFTNNVDAKAVCRIITEVELDRSLDKQAKEKKASDFYEEQLKADRF